MKLIYSHLKTFLPDLSVTPQKLRDDLTLIGHFCNYYQEIDGEIVFDLDIKINRGDCLGYYGLAHDLSVLYQIEFKNPKFSLPSPPATPQLPLSVKTNKVIRVMAQKFIGLKNKSSPDWLQSFIRLHGAHSINTLVDLSNYIMFLYGLPTHAFDTQKSGDELIWQLNPGYRQMTTLDRTNLTLKKDILMINNMSSPLSLSFWGGQNCAISESTHESIVEIGIYDPLTVRLNMQALNVSTEAGVRLEKLLDPNLIPLAFAHLTNLISQLAEGQPASAIFDYYPRPLTPSPIDFEPASVSGIAGIDIPSDFIFQTLEKIAFTGFIPPSLRPDITLPVDITNEVIRFWGIDKIPVNQALTFKALPDITPPILYLIDSLKDKLTALGYDEIISWPLLSVPQNPKTVVKVQNSINTESVYLRQSLIPGLIQQLDSFKRLKVPQNQFFEIGKVYFLKAGQYQENFSLGLYHHQASQLPLDLRKLNLPAKTEGNFAEIILDNLAKPQKYLPRSTPESPAIELKSQIITLLANVLLDQKKEPLTLIKKYSQKIPATILWSLRITDIYSDPKTGKYRYTFEAAYYNCDDKTAKKAHLKAFDLLDLIS